MTSAVDVCNNALANIGTRSSISSLTEDSPEARACVIQYNTVLENLLRAAHWGFARKNLTASLLKALPGTPENSTTPTDSLWHESYPPLGWLYSYAYPSDCLLVRWVSPQIYASGLQTGVPLFSNGNYSPPPITSFPSKFVIATDTDSGGNPIKVIATNTSQAILCYTMFMDNPDIWDPMFYVAMQDALAGAICIPLTGKADLAKQLLGKANDTILQARAMDANEGLTVYDHVPDWIRVRGLNYYSRDVVDTVAPYGPLFALPSV